MSQADQIVNGWFNRQTSTPTSTNKADSIVDRWSMRQSGNSSPLDDTNVSNAQSDIGDQQFNGLCERFVEQNTFGKSGLFSSAADAWQGYSKQGKAYQDDPENAPAGSMIYFAPDESNSGDGHVGISDGKGNIIAATSRGVAQTPISFWTKMTGQKPLGYVIP